MTRTGIEKTAGDFQAVSVELFGAANGKGGRPGGQDKMKRINGLESSEGGFKGRENVKIPCLK